MEEIKLVRRIPKSEKSPLGYEYVNEANVFNQPTVLILSGGDTNGSQQANGGAKMAQMLLTGDETKFPKDVQFISAEYPKSYNKTKRDDVLESLSNDDIFYTPLVEDCFNQFFLPLLADNIRTDENNISTDKIEISELKRRFRNLNIVAYSHGGAVAEQFGDAIRHNMQKIGYSDSEIKQAMQEISLLTVGNVAEIDRNKNDFTTLHIINDCDIGVASRSCNLTKAEAYNMESTGIANLDLEGRKLLAFQIADDALGVSKENDNDIKYKFTTHGKKHDIDSYVNFSYTEDSGKTESIPSYAARFLASSVNNSINNNKRPKDDFIDLPTAKELTESNPFQTRLLKKKFDIATERNYDM